MSHKMLRKKPPSGFTLIELMIVITLIVIMAAASVPGFSSAVVDGRVSNLAEDLVRIGRRARSETMGTYRAHRLAYSIDDTSYLGLLTLFRGDSNQCNLVGTWTQIDVVDAVDFTGVVDPSLRDKTHLIDFSPTDESLQNVELCYQPNGVSLLRNNIGNLFTEGVLSGSTGVFDVQFQVTRTLADNQRGVIRYVLFPYGGNARIRRAAP